MRLSIVQSSLTWENPDANRQMFSQKLAPLRGRTDLVVLPEMFTTGFSMNAAALAEPMDGATMHWLEATAKDLEAAVAGSFICSDDKRFFNRLIFMRPNGQFDFYDKKHLFALSGEHEHYTAGNKQVVVEWQGWLIRPLVCYDLRFPVWSRNAASHFNPTPDPSSTKGRKGRRATAAERSTPLPPTGGGGVGGGVEVERGDYDLLIYVANWPARRAYHWRSLLVARAIENQAFAVGVNIFGMDGNGLVYAGDSTIVDFSGQQVVQISGREGIFTAELSLADLQHYRRQLPFLQDGDAFQLC